MHPTPILATFFNISGRPKDIALDLEDQPCLLVCRGKSFAGLVIYA